MIVLAIDDGVEVNEELLSTPEILNEDSYEKGWLIKVETETSGAARICTLSPA